VRTALLDAHFRPSPNIRAFSPDEMMLLGAWAPEALVLPLGLALSLADQKQRGRFDLPSLNTAIIVLTSIDDSPLAAHYHDLLWSAFGVPIFEQLRGADGTVIARECEVHDGLHIDTLEAILLPQGEIVTDQCACGAETPRLRSQSRPHAKHAAASSH
jgi:hypothetical protein